MKVLVCSPLDTLHTPIVQSSDLEAKYSQFGENTTIFTDEECPVSWTKDYITLFSILETYICLLFSFILIFDSIYIYTFNINNKN